MREPLIAGESSCQSSLDSSNTNQGYKALEDWMQEIMKEKEKPRQ
jgi:hypothetical protein